MPFRLIFLRLFTLSPLHHSYSYTAPTTSKSRHYSTQDVTAANTAHTTATTAPHAWSPQLQLPSQQHHSHNHSHVAVTTAASNQGCGSAFISSGSGSGSRALMTKNLRRKITAEKKFNFFWIKNYNLPIPLGLHKECSSYRRSLQLSKEAIPTLQNMNFSKFFLLLWLIFALLDPDPDAESGDTDPIESGACVRSRVADPDPDSDPLTRLNPDPIRIRIRIRIRNPASNTGTVTTAAVGDITTFNLTIPTAANTAHQQQCFPFQNTCYHHNSTTVRIYPPPPSPSVRDAFVLYLCCCSDLN